ncbi:MAG: formate/nitrite transporter family protein [Oscillibacter sp.]|nr:formate/nitrite transporter family protein [Oscillibacter sp.]
MRRQRVFLSAVLAGICIALGGTVYLSLENRIAGAVLFTVGLFTICTQGFHLFTGKVCYIFSNGPAYALDLPVIWLGNLCGAALTAWLERRTRIGGALAERAEALCRAKAEDSFLSILILAVFCNILIYIAVEGFRGEAHPLGKYLSLFFGVAVFLLSGFEHCVAAMYYGSVAGAWSVSMFLRLLVMTLGNALGGVLFPLARRLCAGA